MGLERNHSPRYWRIRAEEPRAKADEAEYAATKNALRLAARTYDDLAHRAERITKLKSSDSKAPSDV